MEFNCPKCGRKMAPELQAKTDDTCVAWAPCSGELAEQLIAEGCPTCECGAPVTLLCSSPAAKAGA